MGIDIGMEARKATGPVYTPEPHAPPDLIGLPASVGQMRVARTMLRYETVRPRQFIDITDDVERVVALSGVSDGWVTVFSRHTTAAIKINEHGSRPETAGKVKTA